MGINTVRFAPACDIFRQHNSTRAPYMQNKARTLSDIAKIAGVSDSTVSRALSNNTLVNEKTRIKIQKIAADNDFKVNTTARNLRLQKSNTIAVVLLISSKADQAVSDPFILSILGVIADELNEYGYDMLLSTHKGSLQQLLNHYFDSKRADGLIVFGQGDNGEEFSELLNSNRPIVVWGANAQKNNYITVGTDNVLGGKLATEHLIAQGRKKIAFAGHLSYETNLRYQGYKQALEKAGFNNPCHLDIHFTYEDSYKVTRKMLTQGVFDYDAIFAASNTIALGIIRALKETGIDIPKDVAIVGYDDIDVAAFTHPALTSVRQDTRAGGKHLVQNLFALMSNLAVESSVLPTELMVRDSSVCKDSGQVP
jgi:DNA-binding LacI/PurR family transcriptional regulator